MRSYHFVDHTLGTCLAVELAMLARGEAGEVRYGELYDWFFGYSRFSVYLNLHLGGARDGRVLVVGCGNSEVSLKMWEDGWR